MHAHFVQENDHCDGVLRLEVSHGAVPTSNPLGLCTMFDRGQQITLLKDMEEDHLIEQSIMALSC